MKKMEEKILAEGEILSGGVLKVGSFLNQQIDTAFMKEIGQEMPQMSLRGLQELQVQQFILIQKPRPLTPLSATPIRN
jgi:hypothetical protein